MSAKHLQIVDLPLIVAPHPLNDLTPEDLRVLADAAYPLIIEQLTNQQVEGQNAKVNFVRPAERNPNQNSNADNRKDAR